LLSDDAAHRSGKPTGAGACSVGLTDRFDKGYPVGILQAEQVLSRLGDEYDQAYYAGIICERRGKARLHQAHPGSGHERSIVLLAVFGKKAAIHEAFLTSR
jgi:hypothetical protein